MLVEDGAASFAVAARIVWHLCRLLNVGHCTSFLRHEPEFFELLYQANGSKSCVGCETQRCAVSEQAHSICSKRTHRVNTLDAELVVCERRFGDYLPDAPQMRAMRPAAGAPSDSVT